MYTAIDEVMDLHNLEQSYREASRRERLDIIREHYTRALPKIMSQAATDVTAWAIDPYELPWNFNKNEQALWASIRRNPMVLYPEFPVLGYFVDFGNPFLRIAVEADSKQFHRKEKDLERDRKLCDAGWKVFRVQYHENAATRFKELGDIREMVEDGYHTEASNDLRHWLLNTSDGLIDALCFFYFMTPKNQSERTARYPDYRHLAEQTLRRHRYVDFALPS
jgi:very-short-patch-repair endonuclease